MCTHGRAYAHLCAHKPSDAPWKTASAGSLPQGADRLCVSFGGGDGGGGVCTMFAVLIKFVLQIFFLTIRSNRFLYLFISGVYACASLSEGQKSMLCVFLNLHLTSLPFKPKSFLESDAFRFARSADQRVPGVLF